MDVTRAQRHIARFFHYQFCLLHQHHRNPKEALLPPASQFGMSTSSWSLQIGRFNDPCVDEATELPVLQLWQQVLLHLPCCLQWCCPSKNNVSCSSREAVASNINIWVCIYRNKFFKSHDALANIFDNFHFQWKFQYSLFSMKAWIKVVLNQSC